MTARSLQFARVFATAALMLALLPGEPSFAQTLPSVPVSTTPPAPSSSSSASTVSPTIHPGDQLAISVFDAPNLPPTVVVQSDGTIQYPLAGRVFVAGMSAADARDVLTHAFRKYLKHPVVTVGVQQQGQISVLVLGNVKTTGRYTMRSGSRLTDAIAVSSGVGTMNGAYPTARVSEADGTVATASLEKLLRQGDATQNLPLDDNAIVYVTGAETIRVQVLGAVSRPGNVDVNEGDHLTMALARAGADTSVRPDLNHVYLTRVDPATGKTTASFQLDLYQALQRGDQRYDPVLQKDDKIYVPETRNMNAGSSGLLGLLGRLLRI